MPAIFSSILKLPSGTFAKVASYEIAVALSSSNKQDISFNRHNGVVIRASASHSVELGFISKVESHQKTLKNDIPASRSAQERIV